MSSAAPPDGRSPAIVPLQVVFAVNGAVYGTLLPRYPALADRFEASEGTFGLALLGAGIGGTIGAIAYTRLARAAGGPMRVLALSAPVMVLCGVLAAAAPSVLWLGVALGLLGLVDGNADPAMNSVAALEQERTDDTFMGRLHATWSAATLGFTGIGAAAAALDIDVLVHVTVVSAVLLAVVLVSDRRLADVVGGIAAGARAEEERAAAAAEEAAEEVPPGDADLATSVVDDGDAGAGTRDDHEPVAPSRWTWFWVPTILLALAALWIEIPPQEWSALLLRRELDATPGLAGTGPFAFLGGVLAGRLVLDRAVRARGWRWTVTTAGLASLVGMLVALPLGAVTQSPWPVLVGLFVAGVGAAPHFPMLFDRAGPIAKRLGLQPDAGAGLLSGVARGGSLVAPVLIGQVADRAGLFVALGLVPVGSLAIVVCAPIVLRRRTA